MLNYKQIWHGIKPIRWLNKFNLTILAMEFAQDRVNSNLLGSKTLGLNVLQLHFLMLANHDQNV